MGADVVQEPPSLDRESLDRNLEEERTKGLTCPCCQKVNEWNLGPKTRTEILDTILKTGVDGIHEKFIRCQNAACPPFLRRITAGQDATLEVKTIPLDTALVDLRYARAMAQVANQHARGVEAERRAVEEIRDDLRRQIDEFKANAKPLERASAKTARLERDAADLDAWLRTAFSKLGFADTDDRTGFTEKLDAALAASQMLSEMARLGNTTPEELLRKAEAFAAKHGRR